MIIRIAEPADSAQVAAIYEPFVRGSHTSFEVEAPDAAEMARRIESTVETHPWLVAESGGEVLGYVYATPHRTRAAYQWCVETTVYVAEGARRSGVGRRLYEALFHALALQGFQSAYAGIALPNAGSVALHEALGFRTIGVYPVAGFKDGRWIDVLWLARPVRSLDPDPQPPLPFPEVRRSEAFAELLASLSWRVES